MYYPLNSKSNNRWKSLKRWRTESQGKKKSCIPKTCSVKNAQHKAGVHKIMHERFPKLQIMSVTVDNDAANHNSAVRDSVYISLTVYKPFNSLFAYVMFPWSFPFFGLFIKIKFGRFTVSRSFHTCSYWSALLLLNAFFLLAIFKRFLNYSNRYVLKFF